MNKLIGEVMAAAKLKDGSEVEIRFDHFHYRAYDMHEQQTGPVRCELDNLLDEIGGTLLHNSEPAGEKENAAGGRDKDVRDVESADAQDKPDIPAQQKDEETGDPRGH